MTCPPHDSLHRLFLSHGDLLPTAPLASLHVSFTHRRLARHTGRCIACFVPFSTSELPRCWLHRLFLSLANILPAVQIVASLG
jgi:hypothetical protein